MRLERTGIGKGRSFYKSDDGKKYILRAVDRSYTGRAKPPKYFLERIEGAKAVYVSGLFPTNDETLYSLDIKDSATGVRVMYEARFMEGGAVLEITPKRSRVLCRTL